MCFGVYFASVLRRHESQEWEDELQRADCAQLWDETFGIQVVEGMCMVRSSRVVCCAWKIRCRGKLRPSPLKCSGARARFAHGSWCEFRDGSGCRAIFVFPLGMGAVAKEEIGIFALSSQTNRSLQARKHYSSSHLPVPICFFLLCDIYF